MHSLFIASMSYAGDMDGSIMTNQQPNVAFYPPSTQQQQQQQQQHHVQSHIGTGDIQQEGNCVSKAQRVQEPSSASQQQLPAQSTKNFFSQLDWQSGDAGYTAFADESESDSDESSSSSDEEDEMFSHTNIQSNTRRTHNHVVCIYIHVHHSLTSSCILWCYESFTK